MLSDSDDVMHDIYRYDDVAVSKYWNYKLWCTGK